MSDAPAPPSAAATPTKVTAVAEVSSEREFRQRLVRALRTFNIKELRALWHDPYMEPHMTLFVLLTAAFGVGALIWILEPMFI
jgi:hypothetical protein